MKKRKLKVMNIILSMLIVIVVILLISFIINALKKDFKVILNNTTIETGKEFKSDFKAFFKGIDVTDNVVVETDLNNGVAGIYNVTYTYVKANKKYTVIKKVQVIDRIKPTISLKGGNDIIINIDKPYDEPGYVALDNSDGDITDKVIVTGNVDTTKEGQYIIKYLVKDSSNNEQEVIRKVTVSKNSPLNLDVKNFTLDGFFENVTLKDSEKKSLDDVVFAGDSFVLKYATGKISGENIWYQTSITAETSLNSPININGINTNKTFAQNINDYKPSTVIMTLGTNSVAYMSPEYFYEKYTELVKQIRLSSPKTKIIIQSIPPVDESYDQNKMGINNDKINKFNYYIGKMCEELKVKFLNSAPILKNENGACKKEYCTIDGIYLSEEGRNALTEYIKGHMT